MRMQGPRARSRSPCMRRNGTRQAGAIGASRAGRQGGMLPQVSHLVHLRRAERADRAIAQERLHLALDGAAVQCNMCRMMWRTCGNAAQRIATQRGVLQRSATG